MQGQPKAQAYEISEWLKPEPNSKAKINDSEFFDISNEKAENIFLKPTKSEKTKTVRPKVTKQKQEDDSTMGFDEENGRVQPRLQRREQKSSVPFSNIHQSDGKLSLLNVHR